MKAIAGVSKNYTFYYMKYLFFISIMLVGVVHGQNLQYTTLKGRYIMKDSQCAGFDFIDSKTVLWYNELTCQYADTLRIKWIDKDTFITREKRRRNKTSPPRVEVYRIIKNDGKQVVIKSFWTGWNDFPDDLLTFIKE
ncbi:MAG: hypothetical protein JST50_06380 [Bacteroidetes bacterium]|jgi:hypothetical protein|nr:hypothetical protein [Bacteroidota bacterium]